MKQMNYFTYLCYIVGLDKDDKYRELLEQLHKNIYTADKYTPFYDMDLNRVEDGKAIREEYAYHVYQGEQMSIDTPITPENSCTFLEFLVALARRMENDYLYEPLLGNRTPVWFLAMIVNLRLDLYKGKLTEDQKKWIDNVCKAVVDHDYAYDGSCGGLFPLTNKFISDYEYRTGDDLDCRQIEIWDQMRFYLRDKNLI